MADAELWAPADLANFLGYAESTVARMASSDPGRLPPRVRGLGKPRWVPEVCRRWVMEHSRPEAKVRVGRPRKVNPVSSPGP